MSCLEVTERRKITYKYGIYYDKSGNALRGKGGFIHDYFLVLAGAIPKTSSLHQKFLFFPCSKENMLSSRLADMYLFDVICLKTDFISPYETYKAMKSKCQP